MQQRFARTTFFMVGALLIWLATFICIYVFAALACARGFSHLQIAGLPIVPFVTVTGTILAAIANVSFLLAFRKRTRGESDERAGFLRFVALVSTVIAMVGLAWLALSGVVASSCSPA